MPPGGAAPEPSTGVSSTGGGDSGGRPVAAHPPWVAQFQERRIGISRWTEEDRVAQRLVEAFLVWWTRARSAGVLYPSLEAFYERVGSHENNPFSIALGGGPEASNWCQHASRLAIATGLYEHDIRFKSPPGIAPDRPVADDRHEELRIQADRYKRGFEKKGALGRLVIGPTA